jgi:hypothetical protein
MDIVERVARAILAERGFQMTTLPDEALWLAFNKDRAFAEARAAIKAMREPTSGMLARARRLNHPRDEETWREMIDAALVEPPA